MPKKCHAEKIKTCIGLFSCPYCQEKLVVCQSGHYVRDPFTLKQMMISSSLRRQSSPLARIIRDFVFLKRPVVAMAVGGIILLSMLAITQQNTNSEQENFPQIEKMDKKIQ